MATIVRRDTPAPEAIKYEGVNTNEGELLALCQRVAALGIWPPLEPGVALTYEIRAEDELHPGCSIVREDGLVIVRVEPGNWLVFDLFAPTPLFAATPADLVAFYQVTS